MSSSQQFSLRWDNYLKHLTYAFDTLRTDEDLVDVTLSCEGKRIRAHKMILSACSTYFRDLFKENPCQHPVVILNNVKFDDLTALVDFMYQGEVNVVQEQLASFLTTAELLAVQGLTGGTGKDSEVLTEEDAESPTESEDQLQSTSRRLILNRKGKKSPSFSVPYYAVDVNHDTPSTKRRAFRDTSLTKEKSSLTTGNSTKDGDKKSTEERDTLETDPIEVIPLMPNFKLEMPEYLEHNGSSCSYEENSTGSTKLDDILSDARDDHKLDISQSYYANQSSSGLSGTKSSAELGHLLPNPSTSNERPSRKSAQRKVGRRRKHGDIAAQVVVLGPGRFSCNLCGRIYKHLASLTQHLEMHRNRTTCTLCQTTLSRRTDLRRHMRLKHNM